jgi:hypothetical protein
MADPFSISAGIIGVVSVATQLTMAMRDLVLGWKNAPVNVEELRKELVRPQLVLENLAGFLRIQPTHFEQTSALYSATSDYVVKLEAFHFKLEKFTTGRSFTGPSTASNGHWKRRKPSRRCRICKNIPSCFNLSWALTHGNISILNLLFSITN